MATTKTRLKTCPFCTEAAVMTAPEGDVWHCFGCGQYGIVSNNGEPMPLPDQWPPAPKPPRRGLLARILGR